MMASGTANLFESIKYKVITVSKLLLKVLELYPMTYIGAIILGFIEGATEFIPVSSSGHLIITRFVLGLDSGGLAFDAVLQLATSCALIVYFWKDIVHLLKSVFLWVIRKEISRVDQTMVSAIVIGTIPAVVFGLLLEKQMDTVFRNVHLVALTLVLGSILFWYAQKVATKNKVLSLGRGIIIGFFQCLALVPGVSRSGATISGGLITGLSQEEATRFSFLLSIPVLFGAGLKKLFEVRHELLTTGFGASLLVGSLVAFVTGLLAINFLIRYLKTHNLNIFIWYRVVVAIIILFLW
jgi:undecaprenyl-diphosphatase